MQLPLIALACLVLACVDGIIASNIDQQSALSAESVASLPLQSSIPSSATSLFDYLHAYAYFLIIMSPLFLFRTYLVPNPRLIHSLGGVYLAVMICTAGFLWDATLNGRTLPLNFVLLITFPIAIVCASLAGYFQKLGNLILGLLGGLCLGAFFLETKSGGLIDNSYPGRVAFVVIFGLMGAVLSRWDIDLVFSTSLIGSYTLFYAVSTVENTSFHLAPFWLLIESEGGSKYR